MKTISYTYDETRQWPITMARRQYNAALPQTVRVEDAEVPNPALIASDDDYWAFVLTNAHASWEDAYSSLVRIPVGVWLQRWTAAEKKAIRAMGLQDPQLQAWLDELDTEPFVNLTYASVTQGVPMVCAALEQVGIIPAGTAAERVAAIMAYGDGR